MGKKLRGEDVKNLPAGQKLGCQLSPDASALLGALEYTLHCGSGAIVTRAIVALIETLPRSQADGVVAMMRLRGASLSRLKRSISVVETAVIDGAGEGA